MSLAESASSRKERLEALRKRKAGQGAQDGPLKIKQRNFDPETRALKKFDQSELSETVESRILGVAEKIIEDEEAKRKEELNLLNIAPKRPNWDLKRDLDRITRKLQPQTDEAIKSIIRSRIAAQKGNKGEIDLVGAMDALGGVDDDGQKSEED